MQINVKHLTTALKELKSLPLKDKSALLSHIFFKSIRNKLFMNVSDGKVFKSIEIDFRGKILECDCDYVELSKFLKIVDEDYITIESNIDTAILSTTMQKIELAQFKAQDSECPFLFTQRLSAKIDSTIIISESVFNSIDSNNPKFELNGMLIDLNNKALVSTDTRRLAVEHKDFNVTGNKDITQLIIPKKALTGCSSIRDIKFNKNFISFINDKGVSVRTELLAGKYPEYKRIIPKEKKISIEVNGLELKKVLKKVKGKDLQIKHKNDFMHIAYYDSLKTVDIAKIACQYNSKLELLYSLSATYLYDAIVENEVVLKINDCNLPIVLQSAAVKSIIMPIITDEKSIDIGEIVSDIYRSNSTFKYSSFTNTSRKVIKAKIDNVKVIRELEDKIKYLKQELRVYQLRKQPWNKPVSNLSSRQKVA